MKKFISVALLALAACATVPSGRVTPIDETRAAGCTYTDTVVGSSGWYGVFAVQGIENARADALAQAARAGATNVVWSPMQPTYGVTQISAKAYRCPGGRATP